METWPKKTTANQEIDGQGGGKDQQNESTPRPYIVRDDNGAKSTEIHRTTMLSHRFC